MEDILASIRRILSEDEQAAKPAPGAEEADVLALDESMLVPDPASEPSNEPEPEPMPNAMSDPAPVRTPEPPAAVAPPTTPLLAADRLIAPEAEAATASSVSSLLRTLESGRAMPVYRGGPSLEDMVREELRALLKQWLDTNLPPLVERLVRAEIERLVGRAVG